MIQPGSCGAPGHLWGSLACARATRGGCWITGARTSVTERTPRRCRAFADCIDGQLVSFGYGWSPGSITPHAAEDAVLMEAIDPYVADVLRSDTSLVASFACPLEAVRYAALLHEPGCSPLLRRRSDGLVKGFSPSTSTPRFLRWLAGGHAQE